MTDHDDLAEFGQLLAALAATPPPAPAPRNASEHLLAAGLGVFRAWQSRRVRPPADAVPLGQFIEMRQRVRDLERERDDLVRAREGASHGQLKPIPSPRR